MKSGRSAVRSMIASQNLAVFPVLQFSPRDPFAGKAALIYTAPGDPSGHVANGTRARS
jgi:hypothetical protein